MKVAKWAFVAIASILFLLGTVVLPFIWLESDRLIPHAIDFLYVMNNAFTTAFAIAGVLLCFVFVYAFTKVPSERRQSFIVSSFAIVIGIGMILGTGVPVKAHDACGNKHSIAPLFFAPIFLSDPNKHAPLATYDLDETDRSYCG